MMKKTNLPWFAAGVLIFFLTLVSAFGQAGEQETRGCHSKETSELSFLAGDWKVKSRFRLSGGRWEETDGTAKIKFVFDGCLLSEKLEVIREGRPLTVFALYSYNNISKKYQWAFAHSEHGLITLFEGPADENIFIFQHSLQIGDRTVLFERRLEKKLDGFEMNARRSTDVGKSWREDWVQVYRRQVPN